jgi:hypothetical protein
MEAVSKLLIDRRRNAMARFERDFGEDETASARMSCDSRTSTMKTPFPEEAENDQSIVPEIRVPEDNRDDPSNFQVVPPSPNPSETSALSKQDGLKEESDDDEIIWYHGGGRNVYVGPGPKPPYSSLKMRGVKHLSSGN